MRYLTKRRQSSRADRARVQLAIAMARAGTRALLVDTGAELRVVLSREISAALLPRLRIVKCSGTLTLARLSPIGDKSIKRLPRPS